METALTVNKPTPVDLYSSPTLQELSTKRSFDQAELPTHCETVDQKHDSDNHRCSELLTKLQNEDSVSIQITSSRTRSENSIQIIEYYLLIEVGLKENRRRDILLEDIADASAQFIPIHNQANRYKVVVKLIDDCIPFFSIGPTRIRADIDILNEAKVYVTGTLAHDEKLRGSIAVETLRNNFLIDTDIYLITLQFEKLEVTRKDLFQNCLRAARELAAVLNKTSKARAEHLDEHYRADQLPDPLKLAKSILYCGEHGYGKALKYFQKAKEAYENVLLDISIVRSFIDKNFHSVRRKLDFEHSSSTVRENKSSSTSRNLAERFTQQIQHTTWQQTHVLCVIETLALSQARRACEQLWGLVEDVEEGAEPYPHEEELAVITRDWINSLLKRFIEIDPHQYDSVARHTLANWRGYCELCKEAHCRIEQKRDFEPAQYLSWHVYWKIEKIWIAPTKNTFNRLFEELFRRCFERPWIQLEGVIRHCFAGAHVDLLQSAVTREFARQNKNYAPVVAVIVSDLKAIETGLIARDSVERKNNQAEKNARAEVSRVALALFHEEDPEDGVKKEFIERLLDIFHEVVLSRKRRFDSQKDETDVPRYGNAKDIIELNEAYATLGSRLVADRLEGGPKVSDSPAVNIIVEGLADYFNDQVAAVEKLLETHPPAPAAEDEEFFRIGDDLVATGEIRKLVQVYIDVKQTLGDPAAEDSLRDFAEHVEGISEEVPDGEGIASQDQIENGIPVDTPVNTPAEDNIFPEESSDDSDDDLDIDIDEPGPQQPQPRLPQQLPCRAFESEHRFTEPSPYGQAVLATAGEGHGRNVRPKLTLDAEDDEFIIELGKSLDDYESTLFDHFNSPESRDPQLRAALGNSFDV